MPRTGPFAFAIGGRVRPRRARSRAAARDRLIRLDRELADRLSKDELEATIGVAEHALRIAAGAAKGSRVSLATGAPRASTAQVAAAVRRNFYRGFALRRALLERTITARQVAELLGTTRQTPHDRVAAATLLAIKDRGQLRFPTWQFDPDGPDGVRTGLPRVLKALSLKSDLGRLRWFESPKAQLGQRSPIDALRAGDVDAVVAEAQAAGAP
jgi:hypothetical protein